MINKKNSKPKEKKIRYNLTKQMEDNKLLLIGISVATLMLLVASFGARGDFFDRKRQRKPIPEELEKSLTTTPTKSEKSGNECVVTGCSNQICASEEVVTTCDYKEIYSCYENATCEAQEDGRCGWTVDKALIECLQKYVSEPSL